jgi:hypothetical protein
MLGGDKNAHFSTHLASKLNVPSSAGYFADNSSEFEAFLVIRNELR